MCGIFGIVSKKKIGIDYSLLDEDIKILTNFSQKRGSDTYGVLVKNQLNNAIFKINEEPKKVLKRKDFNYFLADKFNSNFDYISIIGQTRLVTHGSKFSESNNQPLITPNIIGVHNGIFVNLELSDESEKTKNYESIDIKSDSLKFFEILSKSYEENNFVLNYNKILSEMRGNYTIAFTFKDHEDIFLSSNCGSLFLYHDIENQFLVFASEKKILFDYLKNSKFLKNNSIKINYQLAIKCLNKTFVFKPNENQLVVFELNNNTNFELSKKNEKLKIPITTNIEDSKKRYANLKRCTRCILIETYPFINFDEKGVCNYCRDYEKQTFFGEEKLQQILDKYRSRNNNPDCIVGLSGGRDSSYGLHLIKTKYNMNPIAYTWDWGLTTDISRINASKLCGKLGIEHIIRSAKIDERRSHIRANLFAWLKKPHLGMVPMLQAGDKGFYEYGRKLSKELNIKLVIHCTGYQLEQREFFLGFLGVDEKLKNNPTLYDYSLLNKFNMFFRYSFQYFLNPAYFNSSFIPSLQAFYHSFVMKENFLHLYRYEKWEEKKIIDILAKEYQWQTDISYGKNQWRMGDGQTAFNNFIYYTIAGFSEYDNFRANQVREGLITRQEALKLAEEDNQLKYDTLKIFSELVGFNLDTVLSKISCIPKLY
jgi:glucosamine--fructose-6-phosphate aminotransferase (isomerizing)